MDKISINRQGLDMVHYTEDYWEDVRKTISVIANIDNLFSHTILITGATGMICSSVAEIIMYLNANRNANIKLILAGRSLERMKRRFKNFKKDRDYYFLLFDALHPIEEHIKCDYIIHGASPADPYSFSREPVETIMANIYGLKGLLDIARLNKRCKLLYISSSEVYGQSSSREPLRERDYGYVDILNPRSCYPSAKRLAETLCASYNHEFGVEFVIARPGHIYGPTITLSDSRATAQFTRKAAMAEPIVMKSKGAQLRSYCYSLDCASALLSILTNGRVGEAYNISNPNSILTIREMAELFAKYSGQDVIFKCPEQMELSGYNVMKNSSLNSDKLSSLGWKGVFSPEDGVKATLRYYIHS